ncbi:hypothetical protein ACFV9D_38735 [Streptomyces sp. NPDC059875]|uniref:hypothetical protein n=1 Tax=unclassified Streptomyces TaxID=2593676 RepID=UPI003665983F
MNRNLAAAVTVTLVASLGACTAGASPSPRTDCVRIVDPATGRETDRCLPLAPEKDRVDTTKPVFTHPTRITNPLHPSSEVHQVIYGGQVDGKPFRTEFSLLPDDGRTITLSDGERVAVRTLQYAAFSDGRIKEVALDWFAQADDGSVWYLGEDVFNYEDGVVADTEGTWMAGRSGAPAAMIMPAQPSPGDVYRPENVPEVVFEEVTVKAVDQKVAGPYGPVEGAMTVSELHMDGSREEKVFAPGYGEFSTGDPGGDLEAVSLAVPTDATPGPVPERLTALSDAVRAGAVSEGSVQNIRAAWDAYRASDRVPELLTRQMNRDLDSLAGAVKARDAELTRGALLRVAQNDLDLHLRYEPLAAVESSRMELWARQLTADARAADEGAVAGDVTALELTWSRARSDTAPAEAERIDTLLRTLRAAADRQDAATAAQTAPELLKALR